MPNIIHPITDETIADRAIELFLNGYDPLLYAADLGLTPEIVYDQIRATLRTYIEKALQSPAEMGRRGGRATSEAKTIAVRLNAKKGGRPRKAKT